MFLFPEKPESRKFFLMMSVNISLLTGVCIVAVVYYVYKFIKCLPDALLIMKVTLAWVENRLVLNLTYHLVFRDVQKVLNEAQMPLTPSEEHKFVFGEKPPMI